MPFQCFWPVLYFIINTKNVLKSLIYDIIKHRRYYGAVIDKSEDNLAILFC